MLTRLRSALRHPFVGRNATDGFTLIEVVVAMFVFMIIALSILSGVILTKTTSTNAQARQTAASLATAAINVARTTNDLNELDSSTTTQTLAGHIFTVQTTARWAPSSTGATTQCSTGTGAILGKSVEVTVSWNGAGDTDPVTQTTLVASGSAVTEVGNGSIMVVVTDASGLPFSSGAALTVTPITSTGASIPDPSSVPATIDAQGCAFVPNLVPGSYSVQIGTAYNGVGDPYVDIHNNPVSTVTVPVTANSTVTQTFTYDQSTPVAVGFGPTGAIVPSGIQASFVNGGTISVPGSCEGSASTYCLFPFTNGYTVTAGNLVAGAVPGCESVDPTQWQADGTYAQGTATQVVTAPGTPVTVNNLAMGTVSLTGLAALGSGAAVTISAKQQTSSAADPADPGCVAASVNAYSFAPITGNTATLALPFGTWALSYTTTATTTTTTLVTLGCSATRSGTSSSNYVYTCSSNFSPTGMPYTPTNTTSEPASALATVGTKSGNLYPITWKANEPVTTTGTTPVTALPDADVTAPTAPSVYSGGRLTLDPRAVAP